ncbi:hypothetical protein ACT17S_07750 [Glutamicibacter mysorens]
MFTISAESCLGRSIRFNQLPTFIATSAVEYFRMNWMSSARTFIPYRVVLDIDREEDSYFFYETLQHYLRYLSAQDQQNQPELHSMRRLLDMVDAAWLNSANVTDRT